ncbi:glycosyltransferase family 4 protein [Microbacterium wangchenii]|nr:glycosyltransferase family 4 protein [Microbacterium wangchenii]
MRVLFDGFWWAKGPTANQTVMREFVLGWHRAFPGDELVVAVRRKHLTSIEMPTGIKLTHTRLAPQALANSLEIPVLAKRLGADVAIAHNYTPLFGKSLVFIHDLLFEEHPEWFSWKERLYFSPMALMAHRAHVVATSSRTEALRIERLHPRLAPVAAVGLGVSTQLARTPAKRPSQLATVGAFALSVGRLNRRKNLGVALEGALRSERITSDRPLVIVGSSEHSGVGAELPPSVRNGIDDRRVIFLGHISDAELRWTYENADFLLFLSRDEGFGLPPVESQYFGTPVIASDIAVMREVVGENGVFVDPDSPDAVARAIDEIRLLSLPNDEHPENAWERAAGLMRAAALRPSGRGPQND